MDEPRLVVPGITDPNTLARLARARTYPQYCSMVEDALANRCPFCELDLKLNRVVVARRWWRGWQSPCPEKNTRYHFITAPHRHLTDTNELNGSEVLELFKIMGDLQGRYGYTSRGLLLRDGDATLS